MEKGEEKEQHNYKQVRCLLWWTVNSETLETCSMMSLFRTE
jgi:hypothetical protein